MATGAEGWFKISIRGTDKQGTIWAISAVTTGASGVYTNGRKFAPEAVPENTDSAVFVFALP